jgi:hypothetical protein
MRGLFQFITCGFVWTNVWMSALVRGERLLIAVKGGSSPHQLPAAPITTCATQGSLNTFLYLISVLFPFISVKYRFAGCVTMYIRLTCPLSSFPGKKALERGALPPLPLYNLCLGKGTFCLDVLAQIRWVELVFNNSPISEVLPSEREGGGPPTPMQIIYCLIIMGTNFQGKANPGDFNEIWEALNRSFHRGPKRRLASFSGAFT